MESRYFSLFADNNVATMEVAGRKKQRLKEEVTVCQLCTIDGDTIPAEAFCPVCSEHLCSSCATVHQRSRASKHHPLTMKGITPSKQPESPHGHSNESEFCEDHPGEKNQIFLSTP